MKKFLFFILLCLVPSFSFAQEDDSVTVELVSNEPISAYGDRGTWNSTYNEPGAAIYYEEQYHLFVNGYSGFPGDNAIGYRVSDDGITYEWATEEPILYSQFMPNDPIAIAAMDVLVQDDGTWVLYYYNFNSSSWPHVQATIGRATAESPIGPWTADENPVLLGGEEGAWDEKSVAYASVIATEDGYVMFYIGENATGVERLGRATSQDGITWEKDPEPVFELDESLGEATSFVVNKVIFDGERWILAYKNSRSSIGLAFSEDGITWERYTNNPIITYREIPDAVRMGYMNFMQDDMGNYWLFMEVNGGSRTQVYAARVTIP
jgi:predicted GH43/DUF377 family glycosyl hydrolase